MRSVLNKIGACRWKCALLLYFKYFSFPSSDTRSQQWWEKNQTQQCQIRREEFSFPHLHAWEGQSKAMFSSPTYPMFHFPHVLLEDPGCCCSSLWLPCKWEFEFPVQWKLFSYLVAIRQGYRTESENLISLVWGGKEITGWKSVSQWELKLTL